MITGVDEQFGRIVEALDDTGLAEKTIVVFTADHGNCLGINDCVTKNVYFEESMRVPLLIRWPGKIEPRSDDLLISVADLYPTFLDLMGFQSEIPSDVQGISHAELIFTGRGPRPSSQVYMYVPYGQPAYGRRGVRTHRYTLVVTRTPEANTQSDQLSGWPQGFDQIILHDNQQDPYQLNNIADQKPDVVRRLIRTELNPWLKKIGDSWLGPRDGS
jgi:arylsulfatase A-like enzyme